MNFLKFALGLVIFMTTVAETFGQVSTDTNYIHTPQVRTNKKWYESINFRGYTQVRYNRLLETNDQLKCEQCDKSWGENGGISLRRVRLIFFGDIHKRVYMYIQPDFASSASSTGLHFGQLRDAYFDLSFDNKKEFRLRIGQSKIPYGFENMQSSQNRLPLDRNDGLNSAAANERDKGLFFYWAPQKIRERFAYLVNSGLKGSGDYGVFAFGVYDGQIANSPEMNNSPHVVTRLTYPFQLKSGQFIEASIQGYTGKYVLNNLSPKVNIENANPEFLDQRAAATFVLYPQPFGIQTEFNIGKGPQFDNSDSIIRSKKLYGGYLQMEYMIKFKEQVLIPFVRGQYYNGGKKHELDARRYITKELEFGAEWQPFKNFELVVEYVISERTFEDFKLPTNTQRGNLLRLQAQFNY